jgi:hypothetical protein
MKYSNFSLYRCKSETQQNLMQHVNLICVFLCPLQWPRGLFFSHGVRLSPLGTAATVWPTVRVPDDR